MSTGSDAARARSSSDLHITTIGPRGGWDARELWAYRELLFFLTWRDIKVRYKQTALGAAWAILQPLATMVVFSLFFGHLADIPSDGIPYPVFALAGLVPWTFFATAVASAAGSLVEHEQLVSNVYFPRLIMPAAAVGACLVDLAISFVVLLAMGAAYGLAPGWAALTVPLFVALAVLTAMGISLWLAALNVQFRDVRYTLPFIIQLWLFVSPIAYPSTLVPDGWRTVYAINPMVGVIEGFRWALFGGPAPGRMIVVSTGLALAIAGGGLLYFRRMERTFADIV